mgnify:CR=1 FL=1
MSKVSKGRVQRTAEERRKRNPIGVMRRTLTVDNKTLDILKAKGIVPRWVNDEGHGSRIQNFIDRGYDFIASSGDIIVGDGVTAEEKNKAICHQVGLHKNGDPKLAYLMGIRKEFYDEDQDKKEDINKKVDEAIQSGTPTGVKPHGIKPDQGGTTVKNVNYSP